MKHGPPGIEQIQAAAQRIAGAVRRTPVVEALPAMLPDTVGRLCLKLECLQITGSFKPRGALAKATTPAMADARGLITASGGNHGLGVAYAAQRLGLPCVVYLPETAPRAKARLLRARGADVRVVGANWDDSDNAARAAARSEGLAHVHPFADPDVIAGQGTVGLEIADQAPDCDTLVIAVGGGGLIAGTALAARAANRAVRIVGVEPSGAPTLHASREAGRLVTLDAVRTAAGSLAPRRSAALNLEIVNDLVEEIVLVNDCEMRQAAHWLWTEFGIGAELAGAASVAAVMCGRVEARRPLALVCGAGSDGLP